MHSAPKIEKIVITKLLWIHHQFQKKSLEKPTTGTNKIPQKLKFIWSEINTVILAFGTQ